jgi:glutamate mutase epsilon subunit
MTEALEKPIQVRHGTPDARLLAEIAMASGFTSYEGGGISYNIPTPSASLWKNPFATGSTATA